MTQFVKWFKELNLFFEKITQRIGLDSKTWTLCFSNLIPRTGLILMTPRLEASFLNYDTKIFFLKKKKWLKELDQNFLTQRNVFFVWLKEMIFCMAQRINWFFVWLKELKTFFFEYDAENWNLFLWIWRRELMPFSFFAAKNWNFFLFAANDWAFFFQKFYWLKELNFFFWYDSKKWNPKKKKDSKSWTCFFEIWLTELNLFFFH